MGGRVIVSVTSFPARIPYIAPALETIVRQVAPEDKVVLWLGDTQFPNRLNDVPGEVAAYSTERGGKIEFRYVRDVRSFTKLLPALAQFPDDSIITLDDDTLYPETVIPMLKAESEKHPHDIIVHCCSDLYQVRGQWHRTSGNVGFKVGIPFLRIVTGGGGVLYPPYALDPLAMDADLALRLCPTNDDIWFWFCAVRRGTHVRCVQKGNIYLERVLAASTQGALCEINEVDGDRVNLRNLRNLLEYDPAVATKIESIYRRYRIRIFLLRVYRALVRYPSQVVYCLRQGGFAFAWGESRRTIRAIVSRHFGRQEAG